MSCSLKRLKPQFKRNQIREWLLSPRMQFVQYGAHNSAGVIIAPAPGHIDKRDIALRPLHEQRVGVLRQHGRRTAACPPTHEQVAPLLLLMNGDLEDRRHIACTHRQESARRGHNRLPLRRQLPAHKILVEHHGRLALTQALCCAFLDAAKLCRTAVAIFVDRTIAKRQFGKIPVSL